MTEEDLEKIPHIVRTTDNPITGSIVVPYVVNRKDVEFTGVSYEGKHIFNTIKKHFPKVTLDATKGLPFLLPVYAGNEPEEEVPGTKQYLLVYKKGYVY